MSGRMKWAGSVSAFAVGLGVGAAIGVLFSPASGDDTRDYLLAGANDGLDRAVAAGATLTNVDNTVSGAGAIGVVRRKKLGKTHFVKQRTRRLSDSRGYP